MEWKKLGIIFIGFMFILGTVPQDHGYVSASDQDIVILVTDNEADLAMAYSVAGILDADVVVSPWGTYDPAVSAEILSRGAEMVIIIGGPVAVPDDYTSDFSDFGIPYERWYGETRYETNLAVIEGLKTEFPEAFARIEVVMVANGRDGLALREYIEAVKIGPLGAYGTPMILLTDSGRADETLEALGQFTILKGLVYMGTFEGDEPMFPLNRDWMSDFARGRFGEGVTIEEKATSPGLRDTREVLLAVQNKTERAEELLDGLQIPAARMKLESAKGLIEQAWSEYRAGNYGKAYRLAMVASGDADFVIARAYREIMTIYQGSAKMRLERRLFQFGVMLKVLESNGYDVSDIEALLQQAREALNRGDYSRVLNDLIPQIKMKLAEKTIRRHGMPSIPQPNPPSRGRGRGSRP
ncbi:hypothetical protein A3L11_10385 [Thermococcus siculi]|uniref:Cell wall-binding repeat 2 family protein n=1 Tax=Thermococcus siculi TaxID=72803 RepID=A0A2Z2MSG6_9EURY|nr:cell wall-binding repeat-containing protein [Thermococcus siculi]ASJ09617.1 hypothetical protein A3L11_10385 [Thermococcus siculi]